MGEAGDESYLYALYDVEHAGRSMSVPLRLLAPLVSQALWGVAPLSISVYLTHALPAGRDRWHTDSRIAEASQ